jgi:hypothetical protein
MWMRRTSAMFTPPASDVVESGEANSRMSEDRARQLHDRATRGQDLSATERAELDAWYAEQDVAQSALLNGTRAPQDLAELRAQVDEAMSRLQIVTRQIAAQTAENERLRQDNTALQRDLLEARTAQRA